MLAVIMSKYNFDYFRSSKQPNHVKQLHLYFMEIKIGCNWMIEKITDRGIDAFFLRCKACFCFHSE